LRQVSAFFILIAFLGQTFSKNLIEADYYFFSTFSYAKNCENKAKPQMHCNGKCQMMKKIKQEEKKNAQAPEQNKQSKNEIPLSSRSFFPAITFSDIQETDHSYTALQISKEIKMPRSVFHPPIA
jgi:hypothetical protein